MQKYDGNPHGNFKGKVVRPLLEAEMIKANEMSINITDAHKKLGVSYRTYMKYAKMYGLQHWFKNKPHRKKSTNNFKIKIEDLCSGEKGKNYPIHYFKERLIRSGLKPKYCEMCGYKDCRPSDGRAPLVLFFIDGNKKNWQLDNIKMICYNCTFVVQNNIKGGRQTTKNILFESLRWEGDIVNDKHCIENPNPEQYNKTDFEVNINQVDKMSDEEIEKIKREAHEENKTKEDLS